MSTSAAAVYAEIIDAAEEQRRRLGTRTPDGDRWSASATRFTADPRREPDANLRAILQYIEPQHVVIDVGGGAGRYGLPIAMRCREVINVEPAAGMGKAFEETARQAGIENARWLASDWQSAEGVTGDVSLVANVTYFVRDIVPFLSKLSEASRERVIIANAVTPPPNQGARLFAVINHEEQYLVPDHHALVPVLWEMGIEPELRVLDEARATALGGVFATRDEAIEAAVASPGRSSERLESARLDVVARFEELFEPAHGGYRRRATGDTRMLLITWRTGPT